MMRYSCCIFLVPFALESCCIYLLSLLIPYQLEAQWAACSLKQLVALAWILNPIESCITLVWMINPVESFSTLCEELFLAIPCQRDARGVTKETNCCSRGWKFSIRTCHHLEVMMNLPVNPISNEQQLFTKSQDAMSWQPAAAAWPVTTPITGTGICGNKGTGTK